MFERADTSGDGKLDRTEFNAIISSPSLNLSLTEQEVQKLWEATDQDNSGKITFQEFVPFAKKVCPQRCAERARK